MIDPRIHRVAVAAALLVAGFLAAGCGVDPAPTPPTPLRFIEDEPRRLLVSTAVERERTVFSWPLHRTSDLTDWRPWNVVRQDTDDGESAWTAPYADPYLSRDTDFQAGEIDTLRLVLEGSASPAQVYWARDGERFTEERQITVAAAEAGADGTRTLDFDVGAHPQWTGTITRIRLDPLTRPGDFVLHRLEGLRHQIDPESLERAAGRAWRTEADAEIRSVLLAPPGIRHRLHLTVPQAGRLRFGLSQFAAFPQKGKTTPIRLRVGFEPAEGSEETVWRHTAGAVRGWREFEVDLQALAGRTGNLVLETEQATPGRVPLLSSPRVTPTPGGERAPNVVLVSLDTLRADRLSLYGYDRDTSPHLDDWARRRAVVFDDALAPVAWTLSSHLGMFTGLDSVQHGVNYLTTRTPEEMVTLAEALRGAGYATAAFTGGAFLAPSYGLDQGFDRYRYWPEPSDSDDELAEHMESALAYLAEPPPEPYFLFFHTYEVHAPYLERAPHFEELGGDPRRLPTGRVQVTKDTTEAGGFITHRTPVWQDGGPPRPVGVGELDLVNGLYDAGVRYTDAQLGRLLDAIEASDRETLVVITSDHGESLGELGLFGHGNLSDPNLRVPLVISAPGRWEAGRRVAEQVRLVDLTPTVLDLLGLPVPRGTVGTSLRPVVDGEESGRTAWAMAPTSNLGFALRRPGERAVSWNDTPWPPAGRTWNDASSGQSLEPTAEERQAFRRRLLRDLPGLWIHGVNAGDEPWGFQLGGIDEAQDRLGVHGGDCLEAAWNLGSPRFAVPPGCEFWMVVEGPPDARIEVSRTDAAGRVAEARILDVGAGLEGVIGLATTDGGWRRLERAPTDGLTFTRRSSLAATGRDDLTSEEIGELRALGYL